MAEDVYFPAYFRDWNAIRSAATSEQIGTLFLACLDYAEKGVFPESFHIDVNIGAADQDETDSTGMVGLQSVMPGGYQPGKMFKHLVAGLMTEQRVDVFEMYGIDTYHQEPLVFSEPFCKVG